MVNEDCIFCKIAKGEIKADKTLETDNFFVIKDIQPVERGHSLVIPKKHYKTLLEIPASALGEFFELAKEASIKLIKEEKADGFNLVMNNFEAAGQLVPHAHLHIIPRYKNSDFKLSF